MKRVNLLAFAMLLMTGIVGFNCKAEGMPHFGADFSWRALSFKGLNAHLLTQRSPAINGYLGLPFNERVHFEFGAQSQSTRHEKKRGKIQGIHITMVGNYPMQGKLSAVAGIGFVALKLKFDDEILPIHLLRFAPRLLAGVEYSLNENLAWRTILSWENTRSIKHKTLKGTKVRDTYAISTGLKISF